MQAKAAIRKTYPNGINYESEKIPTVRAATCLDVF